MILPLLESLFFGKTRILSRGHFGEIGKAATIPESYPFSLLVSDIETVTGGTKVPTNTAAYALEGCFLPIRAVKTTVQFLQKLARFQLSFNFSFRLFFDFCPYFFIYLIHFLPSTLL